MDKDRFEIGFMINHELNPNHEILSIRLADQLATEAASRGEKGVILCQVFLSDYSDNACVKGRFIKYEAALEIAKILKKYGYPSVTTP